MGCAASVSSSTVPLAERNHRTTTSQSSQPQPQAALPAGGERGEPQLQSNSSVLPAEPLVHEGHHQVRTIPNDLTAGLKTEGEGVRTRPSSASDGDDTTTIHLDIVPPMSMHPPAPMQLDPGYAYCNTHRLATPQESFLMEPDNLSIADDDDQIILASYEDSLNESHHHYLKKGILVRKEIEPTVVSQQNPRQAWDMGNDRHGAKVPTPPPVVYSPARTKPMEAGPSPVIHESSIVLSPLIPQEVQPKIQTPLHPKPQPQLQPHVVDQLLKPFEATAEWLEQVEQSHTLLGSFSPRRSATIQGNDANTYESPRSKPSIASPVLANLSPMEGSISIGRRVPQPHDVSPLVGSLSLERYRPASTGGVECPERSPAQLLMFLMNR
jgi:hypothetical protein